MNAEADTESSEPSSPDGHAVGQRKLLALALGALGVVYGDIGTSPLYALKECFHGSHVVGVTSANVLGVLSLIVWSLVMIISVKYVAFIMRADNKGEGGILALLALILPGSSRAPAGPGKGTDGWRRWILVMLGLFGAALLYGDGVITPAISVLSAVEGLEIATPMFRPFVVPLTVVVLFVLFSAQKYGTARMGSVFGPIMILWFGSIATAGVAGIWKAPSVLRAVSPWYAVDFFLRNRLEGFLVLGAVFLCVTGGEALYADMGHFGRRPIRLVWFGVVLPALLLDYFGQGAQLLVDPGSADHPFYRLLPSWALYPMVALGTMATVIASQALISGAFSLTRQAIQLGYSPRFRIIHTSEQEAGQIYIPGVNWMLMAACIGLVLGFESSSALAAAYGIAVTMTMAITALLFHVVMIRRWNWPLPSALLLTAVFLFLDGSFLGANVVKVAQGGWFPLLLGGIIFTLMTTWKRGRDLLAQQIDAATLPIDLFLSGLRASPPLRVRGTAVFLTSSLEGVPLVLLHHLKHNKALHDQVVLLSILTVGEPRVAEAERVEVSDLGEGFFRVIGRYGFMESPNVVSLVEQAGASCFECRPMETTYYLGRETLLPTSRPGLALWRKHLFAVMSKNAQPATRWFGLPPNRVVEVGAQIEF